MYKNEGRSCNRQTHVYKITIDILPYLQLGFATNLHNCESIYPVSLVTTMTELFYTAEEDVAGENSERNDPLWGSALIIHSQSNAISRRQKPPEFPHTKVKPQRTNFRFPQIRIQI